MSFFFNCVNLVWDALKHNRDYVVMELSFHHEKEKKNSLGREIAFRFVNELKVVTSVLSYY